MKIPDKPSDEAERLRTLHDLGILDTSPDERFDVVTRTAQRLFKVPIALISLIDEDRQWFKSKAGLDVDETPRDMSFCGYTILDEEAFVIEDAKEDQRFNDNPLVAGPPHIRFYAGHPLKTPHGMKVGTLCLIDRAPRTFSEEDIEALADLAAIVERELAVIQLAMNDQLTGLLNRLGFQSAAESNFDLCIRKAWPAALIFIDLDDFKEINDSFGHSEGDRVLRDFAGRLSDICRKHEISARIGGDEFALLMLDSDREQAELVVRRLEASLKPLTTPNGERHWPSFSYGIVEFDPKNPGSVLQLLDRSDKSMYEMKKSKSGLSAKV